MSTRDAHLKINPSDFTNLRWCPLCLWLKLRGHRAKQSWDPRWRRRPGWNDRVADECERLNGRPIWSDVPTLPAGRWTRETSDVISEPFVIEHPTRLITAYIYGRPRFNVMVAEFDDATFGLYKVKLGTAEIRAPERHVAELHAYARAFESTSRDDVRRGPIGRLGLLYPDGGLTVVNVPRDEAWFATELIDVAGVWLFDQPPSAAPGCRERHQVA